MEERTTKLLRRVHIRVDVYNVNRESGQLTPLESYIDDTTSGEGNAKKNAEKRYGKSVFIAVKKVNRVAVVPTDALNAFIRDNGEWVEETDE